MRPRRINTSSHFLRRVFGVRKASKLRRIIGSNRIFILSRCLFFVLCDILFLLLLFIFQVPHITPQLLTKLVQIPCT
jgi:hypothetical protein